jgi:uncharacterized protein YifN (PemK superfamily)
MVLMQDFMRLVVCLSPVGPSAAGNGGLRDHEAHCQRHPAPANSKRMSLRFYPRPGTVLMCNFDTGFKPPEMVKVRPVVTLSPRLRRKPMLITVVPLSSTAPQPVMPFHHRLSPESLPERLSSTTTWVKGDMLYTVSMERLDRVRNTPDTARRRRYIAMQITADDLLAIQQAVARGLGLDRADLMADT